MIQTEIKTPFPWFGGKSRAAHLIWPRLGYTGNYVEPFAGSLAVLLRRSFEPGNEIVNDLDCYVANAWRAVKLLGKSLARVAACDVYRCRPSRVGTAILRDASKRGTSPTEIKLTK